MKKLGIRKDEVSKLISTYARNHNGHVDISQIEEDIKKISNSMIYGLGTMYKDYDIKHEILECGKARQMDGILSLLNDNNQQIALSYLPNDYYENVDTWVFTLYHTAQKQLSDILDGDIDSYRDFVQELPYQNINKVAKTFEMEDKVAKFIALNGEFSDFQQFMLSRVMQNAENHEESYSFLVDERTVQPSVDFSCHLADRYAAYCPDGG